MSLRDYKRKRHFQRTPEPAGKLATTKGRSFVVQKHHASHLHYDFRLELDGVLKSWAVPKGPSLDPVVERLAMHVEDHPVAYGAFEGIIPKGEYGGGTVMLWDRGHWEPVGDPHEGYRTGKLKFKLHGQKLRGGWMLVRTGGRSQSNQDERQWLLFKERDADAKPAAESDILQDMPLSALSGRSLEEIAAERDWVWNSKGPSNGKARKWRKVVPAPERGVPVLKPKSRSQKTPVAQLKAFAKQLADVRFTHPDKVLYPEAGITKLELAQYYIAVADWILPYIADRPLVLVRCPDGQAKTCFYQKHPGKGTPPSLRQIPIPEKDGPETYVVVDDVAGLTSLAQISALEVHAWGSRADKLDQPDRIIFDLDPDPQVPWALVVERARQVRQFLLDLGLETFVKTTGGKGLHLVAPIVRRHDWDEVKTFCKRVADLVVKADPRHFTANMAKAARPGKIFIDYLRNTRGATAVVPYSTRARPGAPVSVPLTWDELNEHIRSDYYTIRNLPRRLASLKRDPWERFAKLHQGLATPLQNLRSLSP